VTDDTWRQIRDRFEGESLGDSVKGKGTMSNRRRSGTLNHPIETVNR